MNYPNLLIFTTTDVFGPDTSETITIRSFLSQWPREKVFQIICRDFNVEKSGEIDDHIFVLGHKDIFLASRLMSGTRTVSRSNILVPSYSIPKKSFKDIVLGMFSCIYDILPYRLSKEFFTFVQNSQANVVYANLTDIRSINTCLRVSSKFNLKIVFHVFDDWMSKRYNDFVITKPFNRYLNSRLKKVFKTSHKCFCIGESMVEAYKGRYKINCFLPLMNSVASSLRFPNEQYSFKPPYRLFFSGSLYLGRYKMLLELSKIISDNFPNLFQIDVFSPQNQWSDVQSLFSSYNFINYKGFYSANVLTNKIKEYDALLLLESFDAQILSFTRLSMSTKVPEYLASNIPILAIGNQDQGSINYLRKHNAAYVACNYFDIKLILESFMQRNNYDIIMKNAEQLFKKNHEKKNQEKLFYNIILESSNI